MGALRGLQSPDRIHTELMHTYAAGYWPTLLRLRFPASVPYLLPALRLGAANAVIGAVVALMNGFSPIVLAFAAILAMAPWAAIIDDSDRPKRK